MKMLVFFRSREYSNAIISSTASKLEKLQRENGMSALQVDFINLDKRNYMKVLKQADEAGELPQYVYIWYDEEKVTDYIHETYPSITVFSFDRNVVQKGIGYYGMDKDYKLADMIVKQFKDNLVKKPVYEVDLKTFEIRNDEMDEMDIATKEKSNKVKVFDDENEAKHFCINEIKKNIESADEDAEYYKARTQAKRDLSKKLRTLLKKKFNVVLEK